MADKSYAAPSPQTPQDLAAEQRARRYSVLIGLGLVLLTIAAMEVLLRVYVNVKAAETTGTAESGALLPFPDSARVYGLRPGLGPPFGTNGHGFRGEPVDVA